jgi:small subunit ribosomal protein S2
MLPIGVKKKLSAVLPCSVSLIELTFEQLVLVDFHVGSKINNFEKLNYHFVFGKRHKNFVVNLQFTLFNLRSCLFFLTNLVSRRGKVLFLDCAPSNRNLIAFFAKTSRQYFCNHKWISGTLTNFKYFYPAVFEGASQHFNLSGKASFGFKFLHRIPNAVCFLDLSANIPAVTEVIRLGIPSISIVNTNLPISGITFPIFANNFSVDSFTIFLSLLRSSILNGYRFEIYKFFRDSIKRALKKRLSLSVFGKSYLDSFFFLLKFTLSSLFFRFSSLLIDRVLLFYDLYLFSFLRSFFLFFSFLFSKCGFFTIWSFLVSPFFLRFENFHWCLRFLNYFFGYFFFKILIPFASESRSFSVFLNNLIALFQSWRVYLRIFYFFNFLYFSKFYFHYSYTVNFFTSSTNLLPRVYFFRFLNRMLRLKGSFQFDSNLNFPIFKTLKSFKLFSKFKSQSFLFFKFKIHYRKSVARMSRFLKSLKLRLKLTNKLKILCSKYLKISSRIFFGGSTSSKFSLSKFSEFSIDEFVLSEIFDDEGLFNSKDWRISHMKFRIFFNSLFLLETYVKGKRSYVNSLVLEKLPGFVISAKPKTIPFLKRNNLQSSLVYFNFLKFIFK